MSGKRTSYTFNGKTQTLSAWARELGVLPITLYQRRRRGVPMEQLLSPTPLPSSYVCQTFEYQGKQMTVKEIAAISGLKASTVRQRMRDGTPLSEPLHAHRRVDKKGKFLEYKGQRHNLRQWGILLGLTTERMRQRLARYGEHDLDRVLCPPLSGEALLERMREIRQSLPPSPPRPLRPRKPRVYKHGNCPECNARLTASTKYTAKKTGKTYRYMSCLVCKYKSAVEC